MLLWKANVQFREYKEFSKQSVRRFLRKKQKIPANIEINCHFPLTEPAFTQQYEHTYKMIDGEKSNDKKRQEEILEIPKNESWNFLRFFDWIMKADTMILTNAWNLLKIKFTIIANIFIKRFSIVQYKNIPFRLFSLLTGFNIWEMCALNQFAMSWNYSH